MNDNIELIQKLVSPTLLSTFYSYFLSMGLVTTYVCALKFGKSLTEFVHLDLEGFLFEFVCRMRRQTRDILPIFVSIMAWSVIFRTCGGRGDKIFLKLPDHLRSLVAVHDGHRDIHEDQFVALASLKTVGRRAWAVAAKPILYQFDRLLTMIRLKERL